jgi:glycine/D-amino acid oxidase-like deaminating enzyme
LEGETSTAFAENPQIRAALLQLLETVILPGRNYQIERWWTGILGVSQQKSPIIQSVGARVTLAVRMGGMGVAIGTLVGQKAAALALQH